MVAAIGSAQRDHRDAIQIAVGHVELRLIRRERHAVGVRARIIAPARKALPRRSDHRDGFEDRVLRGVDHVHGIRLVFGDIQQRLGRVQRHLVRLAFHWDPGRYRRRRRPDSRRRSRGRECWIHTLSRSIRVPFTTTQNGYSPPGMPACEGSLLPGRRSSSVPFDQLPEASGEHRDRVVVVIRHHQRLAVVRNGHAGGARMHANLAVDRDQCRRWCTRKAKASARGPRQAVPGRSTQVPSALRVTMWTLSPAVEGEVTQPPDT